MLDFLRKKRAFDDATRSQFVELIVKALALQMLMAGESAKIKDEHGHLKRKALGYVYGFVDAALRKIGQDMAEAFVGVPIMCHVVDKLWPDDARECMDYLVNHASEDGVLILGMMRGGQQYVDWQKAGAAGVPMGLAIFLTKGSNE